jgi:acyl-CoA synthetase (NDP forming)
MKGADAMALLETHGLPVIPMYMARSEDEAVAAAERCGLPVVLKLESPDVIHKSDVGGVKVDLRTVDDVRDAFRQIRGALAKSQPKAGFTGVQVQAMAPAGTELVLGMMTDPSFGPLIMFGMGGVFVEVLEDVVFRVHPLSEVDAREMIHQIRGYPLLAGARGRPPVDEDRLAGLILRLSQLVSDLPEIDQIDINPLIAGFDSKCCAVIDARIILQEPANVEQSETRELEESPS